MFGRSRRLGHTTLDAVLGLALTPSTIGWVIAEGGVDGCPTISGDEFAPARGESGLESASMAAAAAAVADRVRAALADRGDRLHGVGVTWSVTAAVEAALLLESLALAGFDNVVPMRFSHAAASLTNGIDQTSRNSAVCVIEPGWATVVLSPLAGDGRGADALVADCPVQSISEVADWLAEVWKSGVAPPDLLMVAGSMRGMDRLGRRLEAELSVPVFVQGAAQQALARAAALGLTSDTDLAANLVIQPAGSARSLSLPYAAAMTMLAGGAVTFVASLSAALSMHWSPVRQAPEVRPHEGVTVARVAVPAAAIEPAAPRPLAPGGPAAAPAPQAQMKSAEPAEIGSLWETPPVAPASPPAGKPSLLDRVRDRVSRLPNLVGH